MANYFADTKEAEECEANYFAMCLLMPETLIREHVASRFEGKIDFERGDEIRQLARLFQVSEFLMTIRLIQIYKPRWALP